MSFPQHGVYPAVNYPPHMNYYQTGLPHGYQHPPASNHYQVPPAIPNPANDLMRDIPKRHTEFSCVFTKNDPTGKQKRIPISQFPCTISG